MQPTNAAPEPADFVVANVGSDPGVVRLAPSSNFFSVSPSSFVLDPGATRTVQIIPEARAGGFYTGSATLTVDGAQQPIVIPVRLFIGPQPQGIVAPGLQTQSVLLIGLQNERRSQGVAVSNSGSVTMTGMPGADVPWIQPRNQTIGIAPGTQSQVVFDVEPTQRPDRIAPLGAMLGGFSLLYLKGVPPSLRPQPNQTGQLNVEVMDISKVSVVSQTPAPLAPGEVAAFIPGLVEGGQFVFADLFFSNRSNAGSLSDLRLFYSAAGAATSLLAAVPQLPAGVSAWFPSAPRTLYNVFGQSGTLQVRTAQLASASVSAIRANVPDANRYLTALPLLRSDRAATPSNRIIFAGVEKSASMRTDLHLQEANGFAGSYSIDFFDAAGAAIGSSRTGTVLPFGYVNLADSVPSGGRSARVTNTSSGTAAITGYASVIDQSTGDWWTSLDANSTELFLPFLGQTFDVFVTAASATQVSITTSPITRGRAVRRGTTGAITLAPMETRRVTINDAPQGYIRIAASAPVSATARLTRTVANRSFGTGVPALPGSSASAARKRFSRANDVPNISPPTLLILEAAGHPATVRVSIRFNFPAGSTVTGQASASKDYDLAAGQLLRISDIARNVLGAQRDALGTLWNLIVDVEVISGSGRILPYLQTVDASGDLTLSVD